jgi:hypothetical protein
VHAGNFPFVVFIYYVSTVIPYALLLFVILCGIFVKLFWVIDLSILLL